MKILLFSSLFPNAEEPTLGIFVENRLRHLMADAGVEATVVAPVPWFPFKNRIFGRYGRMARVPRVEVRHGIQVYHPRFLVIPRFGMRLTPRFLYRAARRQVGRLLESGARFDLIDAHYLYPDGVAAARLAAAFGLPFFLTARGSDVTQIAQMPGPRAQILDACRKARQVITVSESLRQDLVGMGLAPGQVTTLRNGVDCRHFRSTGRDEIRARWGVAGTVLLFAGWLIERKRVDVVLDVAAALPDVTVVVAGDGPLRGALEMKAQKLDIGNRVRFIGQQAPEQMPAVMSGADILMLPSEREGWPNVLLEAMACGTPVVARAIGGAPDFVTVPEAGRLAKGGVDAFVDAVGDLLANYPDRAAVRAYAETFGWLQTSKGQERLFLSVSERS
ncbi:MAG: glycosyltransferase family 4 protein [Alphaproteobacteria bacterium]|nr:MAG: glycosyltransferase family 4 protein [Alphaproteobacteria bacterium]